jgi:hypothetical protein
MKRNFVVSVFGSLVGFGMLLILLSATGSVGARGADIPRDQARPASVSAGTPLTSTFTYQGQLKNGGAAVNGLCAIAFRLYDDPSASNLIGTPITPTVPVTNGLFTVGLNFGSTAFNGNGRWLDMQVNCNNGGFTALTPRQAVMAVPYALFATSAGALQSYPISTTAPSSGQVLKWNGSSWGPGTDNTGVGGSFWSLTGNSGTNPNTNFLGTTNNVSLTLRVSNTAAFRIVPNAISPNIIGGYSGNIISSSVVGGVIGGGGSTGAENRVQADWGVIGGGFKNIASGNYSIVSGGNNNAASGAGAFVGGGGYDSTSIGGNKAQGNASTIGGGITNTITASGAYAFIGGGRQNTVAGNYSTIGGGWFNSITSTGLVYAFIGGGTINQANGYASLVSGGAGNIADGSFSTVAGGRLNIASNTDATIGGGQANIASGYDATVGGGQGNTASHYYSTVSGGAGNIADGHSASVSGGANNIASGAGAFVGGGGYDGSLISGNKALGPASTIGGGYGNFITTTANYATVSGGSNNIASSYYTIVGGGTQNIASSDYATASGGEVNTASGHASTVSGGFNNTASGWYATIPGGDSNIAQGTYSFAAGHYAYALHDGTFVWADAIGQAISSTANNQFIIRASGGVGIGTNAPSTSLQVAKDFSTTNGPGQIEAIGATNNNQRLTLGFDTTNNVGWIAASETNVAYRDLALNPDGASVGIGTTTMSDRLTVNGDVRVGTAGTNGCVKRYDGTALTGSCSSDARLKKNVLPFPSMLDKVVQLQPVYYNWRADEFPEYHFSANTQSYGVIAQDVEQVLPELVGLDEHGYKTVNYSEIPLLLLQAIKDLRGEKDNQIAVQQKQIDALQLQNADLQARLSKLEHSTGASYPSQPESIDLFKLLSVIAFGAVVVMWIQQRRSKRGAA